MMNLLQPSVKFTYESVDQISRVIRAVAKNADENDYCVVCDNHPSHGHAKDCPVKIWLSAEQPSDTQ